MRKRSSRLTTPRAVFFLFVAHAALIVAIALPSGGALKVLGGTSFVYPVMGPRLSSGYGMRVHPIKRYSRKHQGVDLAAPLGSPIRAVSKGVVVFADPYAGYGKLIVIRHGSRVTTHYAHCDSIKVKIGQKISAGDIIGTVGNTGHSTGPHLHFEMRVDGTSIDPERFIPDLATSAAG